MQTRRRLLAVAILVALAAALGAGPASAHDDEDEVEFHGVVEALPAAGLVGDWAVSGRTVHVTAATHIDQEHGAVALGAFVEVKGLAEADGSVTATKIEVKEGANDDEFGEVEFHGVVEALPAAGLVGDWTVSGRTVHVAAATRIDQEHGAVALGAFVEVKGLAEADGSITATKVEVEGPGHPDASTVSLLGSVQRLPHRPSLVGNWRVSHHTVRVRATTRVIHGGLAHRGAKVKVVGRWLRDGSIRASRVVVRG